MIIFDDFDQNNIDKIELFDHSNVYNRLVLSGASSGAGMYIFGCNFGTQTTVELDIHKGQTRVQSGNISASVRAIVNYINNTTAVTDLGISASIIKNYRLGSSVIDEVIYILIDNDYEDITFIASPYYLLFTSLDYILDVPNDLVLFTPQQNDPNTIYGAILADEASELRYGTQLLSPNLTFIGSDFYTYLNLVNNFLGFYNKQAELLTLTVNKKLNNTLPLEEVQVRLDAQNAYKYKQTRSWQENGSYIFKNFYAIGVGKLSHSLYKVKLKEILSGA